MNYFDNRWKLSTGRSGRRIALDAIRLHRAISIAGKANLPVEKLLRLAESLIDC